MTKFNSSKDQGYRSIRDQLRIWVMEIKAGAATDFAEQASKASSHVYSGSVNSNGGQVNQGNLTSFGNLNLNYKREGR